VLGEKIGYISPLKKKIFSHMFGIIRKLFGTQSERRIQKLRTYVTKINEIYEGFASISNDALRAETDKLREQILAVTAPIDEEIASIGKQIEESTQPQVKYALLDKIEKKEALRNKKVEDILMKLLPTAFAIIKDTARRFKEQDAVTVKATDFDRTLAEQAKNITLEGDQAHWNSSWDVRGELTRWDMLHYDVQLIGGIVLHQGKIAEMGTGEGKTLVATLPAFLNALTKQGVHVMTVNDYLAQRDAEWIGPIFQFHGISVACLEGTPIRSPERKSAYNADITYGTSSSFGFDYLYDNMAATLNHQVQRKKNYVIIDEIDSILIDDATTPLIISGPSHNETHKAYQSLKPRVRQMYQIQQHLVTELLKEAKEKIANNKKKAGGVSLFRAYRALPTYEPLISFLSQKGIKKILVSTEDYFLEGNSKMMPEADAPLFFTIDKKFNTIELTDKGIEYLTKKDEDSNFFVLPDIGAEMAKIGKDKSITDEAKATTQKKLIEEFSSKSARIHAVNQLLKAYSLYRKNTEYIVVKGSVKIVDEKTGRVLEGRRYSAGLHQALEAKEDLTVARATQTYATITAPNLFRMYHKMSGMTGTAATEAVEFLDIYKLDVIVIPPNKPVIRKDFEDCFYKTEHEKFQAVAKFVKEIHETKRPILLITPSVQVSEQARKLLNVPPSQVLNAKNHALEAGIIAKAGELGAITIATQMAGRGTDIKVGPEAEAAGGLFVMIVEKSVTQRVDNQAKGRAGRQGQSGSSIVFLSLEDPLVSFWRHSLFGSQADKLWTKEGDVLQDKRLTKSIEEVQRAKENNRYLSRKRTLEYDNVLDKQRTTIYLRRNHALANKHLNLDIKQARYSALRDLITLKNNEKDSKLYLAIFDALGLPKEETLSIINNNTTEKATKMLYKTLTEHQEKKEEEVAATIYEKIASFEETSAEYAVLPLQFQGQKLPVYLPITDVLETQGKAAIKAIQSSITLSVIDSLWTNHLQQMDELKESVRTASYEQKDPLLVYKFEALKLFKQLVMTINQNITLMLITAEPIAHEVTLEESRREDHSLDELRESVQMDKGQSAPVIMPKITGRNERVTVRYEDGTLKENVKYKVVEKEIEKGKCVVVME
jgi:preprotein translocase subunit SecA